MEALRAAIWQMVLANCMCGWSKGDELERTSKFLDYWLLYSLAASKIQRERVNPLL